MSSPASPRAVSDGSSASTVPVPTRIASLAERCSCTRWRAAVPVIHWLLPSAAAARPSSVDAHLTVMYGRRRRAAVSQTCWNSSASSRRMPPVTVTPALASRSAPPPATGPGSLTAKKTARDARLDQRDRARSGVAGVVAGFEGDDGGQSAGIAATLAECIDLGVRRADAPVPALGNDRAGRRPGARIRPAGFRRWPDRVRRGRARGASPSRRCLSRLSFIRSSILRLRGSSSGSADAKRRYKSCAASHPDFNRRSRSFTESTVAPHPCGRAPSTARGLSPPVRTLTDPGARSQSTNGPSRPLIPA